MFFLTCNQHFIKIKVLTRIAFQHNYNQHFKKIKLLSMIFSAYDRHVLKQNQSVDRDCSAYGQHVRGSGTVVKGPLGFSRDQHLQHPHQTPAAPSLLLYLQNAFNMHKQHRVFG
jgi:hypothetical protein